MAEESKVVKQVEESTQKNLKRAEQGKKLAEWNRKNKKEVPAQNAPAQDMPAQENL